MNRTEAPRVSIIIPVYNGANYMREAIDSALAQSYDNLEIIVVNDGSTDGGETDAVARSYGDRIRYLCKENGGVSSALNYGIRHMTGEYVSWLSHDDAYAPDKIRHQIDGLTAAGQDRAVALCAHCFINGQSERLSKTAAKRFDGGVYDWRTALGEELARGTFNGCAMLIPKAAFDECGLFHEDMRFSQDFLMWMLIFLNGYSLVYNPDEDVYSRIHGKQLTQTGRTLFQKDSMTIGNIVIPRLMDLERETASRFLYAFAKRNAKYGNRAVVHACLKEGKKQHLLTVKHGLILRARLLYGGVRPGLRKIYYRLFVKAK